MSYLQTRKKFQPEVLDHNIGYVACREKNGNLEVSNLTRGKFFFSPDLISMWSNSTGGSTKRYSSTHRDHIINIVRAWVILNTDTALLHNGLHRFS